MYPYVERCPSVSPLPDYQSAASVLPHGPL